MKKVLISFLNLFHLLIIIVCFSLSFGEGWEEAYAQIVIEERVEISPEGINNILPTGSISGDDRNPVYLGYGGEVTLRLIHRTHNSYQLWEETLGQLTISGTTSIGTFPQWHKFIFYLLDPATGNKYYPQPGDDIVWDWGSTIDFYPSHQPGDPYPYNPEDWWEINIDVDYSLAAMPPQEILDYLGNPFAQSEPLEVPLAGSIYAIVYTYTNADDALWMDLPEIQLIQDNLINHDGETFELGDMTTGDEIRFFLNSSNTIVSGSNLYLHSEVVEEPTPGGDIHLWTLYFEDWTDLLFDDVEVEIYIRPEEPYPGNIAAIVEPEELAPGDTASITFKKRYLNGTFEDFPEWKTFEVGMVEGCDLGNLLVDGELAPYFYDVMQPVYFVADSSADTGTVKLQVALVEEIIGLRPVQNNSVNETDKQIKTENPKQKRNLKEVISARRENRNKPVNENKKIYENVTPNNPENSSCPLLEFNNPLVSNFDFNVVGDECDFWSCQTGFNNYKGNLGIKEVRENYNNINFCSFSLEHMYPPAAGIFKPLFDEEYPNSISEKIKDQLLVDFNLEVCYSNNDAYWKYQIPEDSIFLRAILDVCEDNILDGPSEYIIHDLNELSIIPNEEVCMALENFEDQRTYGGGGMYYLIAPVWAHEKVHKLNFKKLISEVLNLKMKYFGIEYRYKDLLSNIFQPECNESINNDDKARFQIRKHLNDILNSFVAKLKEQYEIARANEDNETNTQNHPDVQWKITEYKKELQTNRSKEFWQECPYKEKDS